MMESITSYLIYLVDSISNGQDTLEVISLIEFLFEKLIVSSDSFDLHVQY